MTMFKFPKDFAVGADISWYPQMLESGFMFRNRYGQEQNLLLTLKDYCMDTVRLRTWVNPSGDNHRGHCSAAETMMLAKECQKQGYRIMLNFHYSDSWADPVHQIAPAAWRGLDLDGMVRQIFDYTYKVCSLFKDNGVRLEWAQIGNETNPGMLLPMGSIVNFAKLTRFYNAGHDAIKAASEDTKTIIHLAEFNHTDFIIDYFDSLNNNGCRYDMMGFSFYPYHLPHMTYDECMEGLKRSLAEIPSRYGKDIMIVETGGVDEEEEETRKLFEDVLREISYQPKCKGFILWEPQGARSWSGYPLSAWRDDGCPSAALDALCYIKEEDNYVSE